jgi:4'-phosphopantetheinyl transferase
VDVYWLEQTESDVPGDSGWLSPAEAAHLETIRFAKRRNDWRLGRWTAKLAVALYLERRGELRTIEIAAAPGGAPEAYLSQQAAPVSLSLSHSNGVALCALAPPGATLGCDLEAVEPRSDNFLADYFTSEEQECIVRAPPAERFQLLALFWSAKESALKALRTGLRLDTRCAVVTLVDGLSTAFSEWRRLQVRCSGGPPFDGWWRHNQDHVRTLVAAPPPLVPITLDVAAAPMLQ